VRGVYTAAFRIAALNAAKTLYFFQTSSKCVAEILSASVTNESNETSEQLACGFQRPTSFISTTGTIVTPKPHEPSDKVSICNVIANVTPASEPVYPTILSSGDIPGAFGMEGFSSLGGWYFDPIPEERLVIEPSGSIGLRIINPPIALDLVLRLTFREIG